MIDVIRSEDMGKADFGWLQSKSVFSFGVYYNPDRIKFGPLRVFNDDIIQPNEGFGLHPHREMEIVTIMIEGTARHGDSQGDVHLIHAGEIQRISAGTGIEHFNYNDSDIHPLRLLQIWLFPNQSGLTPSWEQRKFEPESMQNLLLPVVSGASLENTLYINQDTTFYMSVLEANHSLSYEQKPERLTYFFLIDGKVLLNQESFFQRSDAAWITNLDHLTIDAIEDARILIIDLPQS
ncbi:pirin family protein [Paenibacillus sp. FSL K6-0276]|uniref:pirin family protein n=1 Tax=Paenibacillus sp. FSL K6-0276 TaxID=2921450 RepID=UPI0030EB70D2